MDNLEDTQIFSESPAYDGSAIVLQESEAPLEPVEPEISGFMIGWMIFAIAMVVGILLSKSFNFWKW